eukprot:365122-Chlamydomonas_euryale.AAC.23
MRAVKKRENAFFTRKGPDGKPLPPPSMREKIFYGIGFVGLALALVPRVMEYFSKKEDPELVVRSKTCVRLSSCACEDVHAASPLQVHAGGLECVAGSAVQARVTLSHPTLPHLLVPLHVASAP